MAPARAPLLRVGVWRALLIGGGIVTGVLLLALHWGRLAERRLQREERLNAKLEARVVDLVGEVDALRQKLRDARSEAAASEGQRGGESHTDDGTAARRAQSVAARPQPPEPLRAAPAYTLQVVVFTYNRLEGLRRLWKSLSDADYLGHVVPCTVFFDAPKKDHGPLDGTAEWLRRARWKHGPLRVHRRDRNAGLKLNIMESWYPVEGDNSTFTAFFEDDIEVSPYWYRWADSALRQYALGPSGADSKLLGVSLYRPVYDELTFQHMTAMVDNGNEPFGLQQPCSWGAVYFPAPWRSFRDWYLARGGDAVNPMTKAAGLPALSSNTWSHRSSWKKYLIKYMYDKGLFMVYPNLPRRMVFSTNHLMKGEHPTPKRELFELPLLTQTAYSENGGTRLLRAPPLAAMDHYDVACRRVHGLNGYPNRHASLEP
eukprot:TRINITY_DN2144_c0_g1_i1.p1 TRINITY_DN2144_c0_g1~~TRINITY_DN2144_c0_g1_i1.p1  ORF type:complete len:429 (+),score=101.03 TRINITY_DN2144_c0_g1_i1:89-1375(+)